MTQVTINDRPPIIRKKIRDVMSGELFRYKSDIYLMTDEERNGDSLALLIGEGSNNFGSLIDFEETIEVITLNGTITVNIN